MISNRTTLAQLGRGGKVKPKRGPTKATRQAASAKHSALVKIILQRLAYEPGLKLWPLRQFAGSPRVGTHPVFWGLVQGASDILGCLAFNAVQRHETGFLNRVEIGRFFALEVKTGKAKQKPGQREFERDVRDVGGFYAVVHSVDEALAALERARRGETS